MKLRIKFFLTSPPEAFTCPVTKLMNFPFMQMFQCWAFCVMVFGTRAGEMRISEAFTACTSLVF